MEYFLFRKLRVMGKVMNRSPEKFFSSVLVMVQHMIEIPSTVTS